MGFNSTLLILNDHLHDIEKDSEFGKKVSEMIRETNAYEGYLSLQHKIPSYYGCEVAGVNHADVLSIVVTGGNMSQQIFTLWGDHDLNTQEGLTSLVKMMAEKLGYKLQPNKTDVGMFFKDKKFIKDSAKVLKSIKTKK